jgi:hypothetical protein
MKTMLKLLLNVALVVGLAVALVSCGGGEAPQSRTEIQARIAELKSELATLEQQLAALGAASAATWCSLPPCSRIPSGTLWKCRATWKATVP